MKTTATLLVMSAFTILLLASCQRDLEDMKVPEETVDGSYVESNAVSPYTVTHISTVYANGNWVWTWKVQNTNPGNGSNGTAQGLSHWGFPMPLGGCITPGTLISAAYSPNNVNWTGFSPSIGPDPSTSSCMSNTPVFKFDFGTNGNAPSYFRLVINKDLKPGMVTGYYKSGKKTGCGTFQFVGITCTPGVGIIIPS